MRSLAITYSATPRMFAFVVPGYMVAVEEGWPFAGVGAQVVDTIQREAFDELDAPIIRVTGADLPMPYNKQLEKAAKADPAKVIAAVNQVLYRNSA